MARKASQTALGETGWQCLGCVRGLGMSWILRARCPAAAQGCGSSPLHGSWPVGCAPRIAGSDREGGKKRSDFSSLSPHYHVQEFALPWNDVVETER